SQVYTRNFGLQEQLSDFLRILHRPTIRLALSSLAARCPRQPAHRLSGDGTRRRWCCPRTAWMVRPVRARRNPAVADELLSLVHGAEPRELLLDLQNVRYLTTTGLTLLLALRQKVHAAGGRLSLSNPSSQVTEVLEATRLNTLFEIRRE